MNLPLFLVILALLSTPALALSINVSSTDLNLTTGETLPYCIGVGNTDNRTHHNISITNFPHSPIEILPTGSIKPLCMNISRSTHGDYSYTPVIYGFYIVNHTAEIQTHTINLPDLSNHSIRTNDIVQFCNPYNHTRTIKETLNSWNLTIPSNQCQNTTQITYTQDIIDTGNNQVGYFNVQSNIIPQPARDNTQDSTFNLRLHVSRPIGNLSIDPLVDHYILPYDQEIEAVVRIQNDELHTAGIQLSMTWGTIDNSTITLAPNESKFIKIKIRANVSFNEETNKTYPLTFRAKIENFKDASTNISVFIPYYEINPTNKSKNTTTFIRAPTESEIRSYLQSTAGKDLIGWYCFEDNGTRPECKTTIKEYTNIDLNNSISAIHQELIDREQRMTNELNNLKTEGIDKIKEQNKQTTDILSNISTSTLAPLEQLGQESSIRTKSRKVSFGLWIIAISSILVLLSAGFYVRKRLISRVNEHE